MLKGTSRFGAELDSLADFVNFGVAPALILYFWGLHELRIGRLDRGAGVRDLRGAAARALQRDDRRPEPAGLGGQFLHRHSGAGRRHHRAAADLSQFPRRLATGSSRCWLTFLYTLAIALLMVSRLPVFSGKRVGKRVPPEMVLPVFVVVVLFFALLISYPWEVLTIGTLAYLGCLPLGWLSYREYQRKDAAAAAAVRRPRPTRRRAPTIGAGQRYRSRASRAAELSARRPPTAIMPRATSVLAAADRHDRPRRRHADPRLRAAQRAEGFLLPASKAPASSSICTEPVRLRTDDAAAARRRRRWSKWWRQPEPLIEARAADLAGAGAARLASRRPPCAGAGAAQPHPRAARSGDRSVAQVARRESDDDRGAVRAGRRRLCVIACARSRASRS